MNYELLARRNRSIYRMRKEGYSYKKIATIIGRTVERVKQIEWQIERRMRHKKEFQDKLNKISRYSR